MRDQCQRTAKQLVWVGDLSTVYRRIVCLCLQRLFAALSTAIFSSSFYHTDDDCRRAGAGAFCYRCEPDAGAASLDSPRLGGSVLHWHFWSWGWIFPVGSGLLERTTPSRVAIFLSLNPLTAMLLGAALLNEPITPGFVIGLLAVLIGIVMTARPNRADRQS